MCRFAHADSIDNSTLRSMHRRPPVRDKISSIIARRSRRESILLRIYQEEGRIRVHRRANPVILSKIVEACDDEVPATLSYVTWKRTSFPVPNGSKNRRVTAAIMAQKKLRRDAGEVSITVRMRTPIRLNIHLCHIT